MANSVSSTVATASILSRMVFMLPPLAEPRPLLLFEAETLDDFFLHGKLLARPARVIGGVHIARHLVEIVHGLDELRIVERFAKRVVQYLHDLGIHAFGSADAVR